MNPMLLRNVGRKSRKQVLRALSLLGVRDITRNIPAVAFLFTSFNLLLIAILIASRRSEDPMLQYTIALAIGTMTALLNVVLFRYKRVGEQLDQKLWYDPLTGLLNRPAFLKYLDDLIIRNHPTRTPFALLIMDLDNFKRVNERLSHDVGDKLLVMVAMRLTQKVGLTSVLARIGGDEFAVIVQYQPTNINNDVEQVTGLARSILQTFNTPFSLNGYVTDVGVSIGIALFPKHGIDAYQLVKHADSAMYTAKREQTGVFMYEPSHDLHSVEAVQLQSNLRYAIGYKELFIEYLPNVDTSTRKIVSAEALLRWRHPLLGIVSPTKCIPIAEHAGLISSIADWVIDTALSDLVALRAAGCGLDRISINVSNYILESNDLIDHIGHKLDQYRLSPSDIALEISEAAISRKPEATTKMLALLKERGIYTSIDNFGVNNSSFMYLKHTPVNEIKIDKSLVMGVLMNTEDERMVKTTIQMGHALGCSVCTEGVETKAVFDCLANLGCDSIQGFFITSPLSKDKLQDLLLRKPEY